METFFAARGYPTDLIRRGRERASTKSRAEILKNDAANNIAKDRVPFVTTFHPSHLVVEKIISRNFRILREDSRTSRIFNKPTLKAFRRGKNLNDLLVRNSLPRNLPHQLPGTFPCNRTVWRTCPQVNSSSTITTPKGYVNITAHFFCITENVVIVSRAPNYHRQCTLGRLDAGLRNALESTAEISSTGGMTFLCLSTSTKQIIHWRTWRFLY